MSAADNLPKAEDCNCFAVRSAARHVSQFYDQFLTPIGLRTTQFSILAKLKRRGPLTINALAEEMVMDRTTLTARSHCSWAEGSGSRRWSACCRR